MQRLGGGGGKGEWGCRDWGGGGQAGQRGGGGCCRQILDICHNQLTAKSHHLSEQKKTGQTIND